MLGTWEGPSSEDLGDPLWAPTDWLETSMRYLACYGVKVPLSSRAVGVEPSCPSRLGGLLVYHPLVVRGGSM